MGPKKEKKESIVDPKTKEWSIDDPINTENWKCVVTLAIERRFVDSYAMKEFMEESIKGSRQQVSYIDFDSVVLKILHDFELGELPYKYKFLLNFSSVFQEALEYYKNRTDLPTVVLVKIVKALLFHIREECLIRVQNLAEKNTDPIKAMAERPSNFTENDKKKDVAKKGGNGLKVRAPSVTKEATNLLKRGERAKEDQCVDDAPRNAFFDHYVLLMGFYNPDFPLELIKAGIPLHAVLCIDTSRSGVKWDNTISVRRASRRNTETKSKEIEAFWAAFIKKLWDPKICYFFRDTVFQMYVPRSLLCSKPKLRKFLYKEISYLMYDLSDLKRQLNNYLSHIHMRNVAEKESEFPGIFLGPEDIPNECVSVPIMLQCIINSICNIEESKTESSIFSDIDSEIVGTVDLGKMMTPSLQITHGSCFAGHGWDLELEERGEFNLLNIYYKIKELDRFYDLEAKSMRRIDSDKLITEGDSSDVSCEFLIQDCGENMEKALLSSDTIFHMLWRNYDAPNTNSFPVDYCLYATLMTRVFCPCQEIPESMTPTSNSSGRKNLDLETIENVGDEMRKPHFTVTDGSRSIIKSIPYNMKSVSRDFFCPGEFKVVSPEKLKASSAPQFRITPCLKIQTLYTSEIMSPEVLKNPYERLKGFVNECLFAKTNDFDFLEFLSKTRLLREEKERWSSYNCIDNIHCLFNDSILLMLHNRKDGQNFQHETFNQKLRTSVGLRDFYEYVQEDEAEWLQLQEELYQAKVFLSNKVLESNSLRDYSESDFWLTNSLKYQKFGKKKESAKSSEVKIAYSSLEKMMKPIVRSLENFIMDEDLEGYDLSEMTVQFSGLKTVFYSEDCSVAIQLIERLYGNQDLGIHVTQACHTLHLHSYVCPEPHTLDPFTFHVTYKNGIIVAFGRRFIETFEEVEEVIESPSLIKTKKPTASHRESIKSRVLKMVKDCDFLYDLAASFPNGLCIRTVRNIVQPCYIKQYYVGRRDYFEKCRLFLPRGELVKIMSNRTVQIFKPNTSILTAKLCDLTREKKTGKLIFSKYEYISEEGMASEVDMGVERSVHRYQVFQNTDSSTNRTFFRRRDGTDYMLQSDGTVCVQFKDKTKMSCTAFLEKEPGTLSFDYEENSDEFVVVHMSITIEHPDYTTVNFNTETNKWKILLPSDSTFEITPEGLYNVDIDKRTKLIVEKEVICMNQYSSDEQLKCSFTADLTIFDRKENGKYCQLKDPTGKIFVVEGNSNCYVVGSQTDIDKNSKENSFCSSSSEVELSEFMASTDLQRSPLTCKERGSKLCRENKYFVVKRDLTGMELLHVDEMAKILYKREKGSLLFVENLPGTENRYFVLIFPVVKKKFKKWEVTSILPNPKYQRHSYKQTVSSTYGTEFPPSWLHPFPKKKKKFVVPEPLTCRVFIETKKTKLSPPVGSLDCYFCEMENVEEVKSCRPSANGVEEYLKRLANDNQGMLKEMYAFVASSIINEKKKLKVNHTEKLERFLNITRFYKMMNDYYKRCIKHRIIPHYFQHPHGMSWSILNEHLQTIKLTCAVSVKEQSPKPAKLYKTPSFSQGLDEISDEEIEYDLSVSEEGSFSKLSYRSNLSAETAPTILRTVGVKCKVSGVKNYSSCPEIKILQRGLSLLDSVREHHESKSKISEPGICDFRPSEIEILEKTFRSRVEGSPMCLEDLMYLGLV